jgi:hypothetical protein
MFAVIDNSPLSTRSAYCIATGPQECQGSGPNAEAIVVAGIVYQSGQIGEVQIGIAVPEASTWAMLLIGFAGLGGYAGYRQSRPTGFDAFA